MRTGPVWATVTVTDKKMDQNPEAECNDCGKKFCGGANRILRHIMEKRKCSTPALQKLKAKLIEEEANKATAKEKKQAIVEPDEAAEQPEKKFKIEGGLNQDPGGGVWRAPQGRAGTWREGPEVFVCASAVRYVASSPEAGRHCIHCIKTVSGPSVHTSAYVFTY